MLETCQVLIENEDPDTRKGSYSRGHDHGAFKTMLDDPTSSRLFLVKLAIETDTIFNVISQDTFAITLELPEIR